MKNAFSDLVVYATDSFERVEEKAKGKINIEKGFLASASAYQLENYVDLMLEAKGRDNLEGV
jgi:hypothetical protein